MKCNQAARGGKDTLFHDIGRGAQILLSVTSIKFVTEDRSFFSHSIAVSLQQHHMEINNGKQAAADHITLQRGRSRETVGQKHQRGSIFRKR